MFKLWRSGGVLVLSFLTCVFVFRVAVYVVVVHRIGEIVSVDSSCYLINSLRLTKVRNAPKNRGKKHGMDQDLFTLLE